MQRVVRGVFIKRRREDDVASGVCAMDFEHLLGFHRYLGEARIFSGLGHAFHL